MRGRQGQRRGEHRGQQGESESTHEGSGKAWDWIEHPNHAAGLAPCHWAWTRAAGPGRWIEQSGGAGSGQWPGRFRAPAGYLPNPESRIPNPQSRIKASLRHCAQ
ncbi:hypothetical protein AZ78_2878 [Lysobacter capsici AZ78]|uniref:Uncharacterized protein n=1 Tax=Lysobacter capsici AZ78 TaxID=1444315 RepID=A0A108UA24_9GAMM|nr:hypothetical protein AZ78_2878 [Lysobacter capsici AZ78]